MGLAPLCIVHSLVLKDLHLYGDLHRYIPILAAAAGYAVGQMKVNTISGSLENQNTDSNGYRKAFWIYSPCYWRLQ